VEETATDVELATADELLEAVLELWAALGVDTLEEDPVLELCAALIVDVEDVADEEVEDAAAKEQVETASEGIW
jgi:hypothetical protein